MSITYIELTCEYCNKNFSRVLSEHKRNTRAGRKVFCSRSCTGKVHFKNIPVEKRNTIVPRVGREGDEYSPFRQCLNIARNRSKTYQRECLVSLSDLKEQWELQQGICPYTGWNLKLPKNTTDYQGRGIHPLNASLDRIDSGIGYIPGNIQFVSVMANLAKRDFTHNQMLEFCLAMANKWGAND